MAGLLFEVEGLGAEHRAQSMDEAEEVVVVARRVREVALEVVEVVVVCL